MPVVAAGLAENLEKELQATVLASSELFADSQCREPKFKSLPDYFHAWKNHGYMTSFLGAMIISKVALGSPSYHITKVDYNDHGPSIIHTKQF
ncbi:hypothetical protein EV182_001065 [Spiromyces aspiralis]|uniref:Uncharacterized protein n=1 Tax=Spiromyces aspiralis TaxID=68401 RepID=A0ACC1I1A1_9FUNG|nr:hypothetical protein EV182_001065 [Spiromyces aspiralis]